MPRSNPARDTYMAEVGTIQLEFKQLAAIIGDELLAQKVEDVNRVIAASVDSANSELDGLVPQGLNIDTAKLRRDGGLVTVGNRVDSYYEYLLKQWITAGGGDGAVSSPRRARAACISFEALSTFLLM